MEAKFNSPKLSAAALVASCCLVSFASLIPSDLAASQGVIDHAYFKNAEQSFNRRYEWVLRDKRVYYRARPPYEEPRDWRPVPLPREIDGRVASISSDDEYLVAISPERDVWTMFNGLDEESEFKWSKRWGPLLWTGPGVKLPEDTYTWAMSFFSPAEDGYYTDHSGNSHSIAVGCTSLFLLRGDRQKLTYLDPWLPSDYSYEVCGPNRGRFKALNLASSGSTLFLINRYGDMFTRTYDFDIAGGDWFINYSYESQVGKTNPARQLPVPEWRMQPKIPGIITDQIAVQKVGKGGLQRILRVEGINAAGETGYYEKRHTQMSANDWVFVPTGAPLVGKILKNTPADTSNLDVGPDEDGEFAFDHKSGARIVLEDFNPYCSPVKLRVEFPKIHETLHLTLHTTESMRQFRREGRGLTTQPFRIRGVVETPLEVLANWEHLSPEVRDFLDKHFGKKRFRRVYIAATIHEVVIKGRTHWFTWRLVSESGK